MLIGAVRPLSAADLPARSDRVVHYRIDARLDPETRTLIGHQVLRWRNAGRQPAKELRFHLYLNAFDNNRTTLMAALPEAVERWAERFPGEWGGIDITNIRIGERDVTNRLEFIRPDDGNPDDRTVARLPLAAPIRPRESVELEIDFNARLPRLLKRAGHAAPFFLVAQWFPKIGVFENGEWNCHQYHATTEFFADFGVYEARLAYLGAATRDPIVKPAYAVLDRQSYQSVTYAKTALVLETLDAYLGADRLRAALRAYFDKWQFRHPTGTDWRAVVEQTAGEPLSWFFEQTLDGTGTLDYAVTRFDVREVAPVAGRQVPRQPSAPLADEQSYRVEVVVERRGEVHMPVDIVVGFDDGTELRESWDGRDRWHRVETTGTQRADYAVVDPDGKLALDVNRLNNSRMRSPGTRGIIRLAGRWGLWLQSALHLVTGF